MNERISCDFSNGCSHRFEGTCEAEWAEKCPYHILKNEIEYRKPKEVVKGKNVNFVFCPTCNYRLRAYPKIRPYKYCYRCGQCLNWENV